MERGGFRDEKPIIGKELSGIGVGYDFFLRVVNDSGDNGEREEEEERTDGRGRDSIVGKGAIDGDYKRWSYEGLWSVRRLMEYFGPHSAASMRTQAPVPLIGQYGLQDSMVITKGLSNDH